MLLLLAAALYLPLITAESCVVDECVVHECVGSAARVLGHPSLHLTTFLPCRCPQPTLHAHFLLCSSCTAATTGLSFGYDRYFANTTAQLQGLSKCTSIDYLCIFGCGDCTQDDWCALQLRSITGKMPVYGSSLALYNSPHITSMCGIGSVKGALLGGLFVGHMGGLVSMEGAEGITSVGTGTGESRGVSIDLRTNPVLTDASALANAKLSAKTIPSSSTRSVRGLSATETASRPPAAASPAPVPRSSAY
jgi:hypothetical protein